jgi:PAS domain S-box-containing protein
MSEEHRQSLDFRRIVEQTADFILVLAPDAPHFTILAASDAYLDVTMTTREEIVGAGLFEAFPEHPEDPETTGVPQVRGALERVLAHKEIVPISLFRYDIPMRDGEGGFDERYWSPRNIPVFGDDGEVAYIIHRVEDVTAYVQRERRVGLPDASREATSVLNEIRKVVEEKSRQQFYQLFMQAPAFIAMLEGPDHVFTLSNPAYNELVGHREVIGKKVRQAFPEEDMQGFCDTLDEVFATGQPRFFEEQRIVLEPPGSGEKDLRYATFAYQPAYNVSGEIEGIAVFGFDVTELVEARKQVEEQAERAERESRLKDEFLAMLGHELRNPMAPIATAVDVMKLGSGTDRTEQVDWAVDIIDRQLGQLIRLVDDLLDVARIEQGRIRLERKPHRLEDILKPAVEASQPLVSEKGHTLRVERPEGDVWINVDATRVSQVVANLLNNACTYTPPGGHIELSVATDGDGLRLEVEDDGQGIEAAYLDDIFHLFKQVDTSLDRSEGGLGLGLTLVRRLVEMHGGSVRAESAGLGQGSRFIVELPVVVRDRVCAE